jgi:hypothetical protein
MSCTNIFMFYSIIITLQIFTDNIGLYLEGGLPLLTASSPAPYVVNSEAMFQVLYKYR